MYEINFEIANSYGKILNKIFDRIDLGQYIWNISNDEVFDLNGKFLFDFDTYSGKDFFELINKDNYYLVFLNLIAKNNRNNGVEFELIIADSVFCTLKIKNYNNYLKIIKNLKENGFIRN